MFSLVSSSLITKSFYEKWNFLHEEWDKVIAFHALNFLLKHFNMIFRSLFHGTCVEVSLQKYNHRVFAGTDIVVEPEKSLRVLSLEMFSLLSYHLTSKMSRNGTSITFNLFADSWYRMRKFFLPLRKLFPLRCLSYLSPHTSTWWLYLNVPPMKKVIAFHALNFLLKHFNMIFRSLFHGTCVEVSLQKYNHRVFAGTDIVVEPEKSLRVLSLEMFSLLSYHLTSKMSRNGTSITFNLFADSWYRMRKFFLPLRKLFPLRCLSYLSPHTSTWWLYLNVPPMKKVIAFHALNFLLKHFNMIFRSLFHGTCVEVSLQKYNHRVFAGTDIVVEPEKSLRVLSLEMFSLLSYHLTSKMSRNGTSITFNLFADSWYRMRKFFLPLRKLFPLRCLSYLSPHTSTWWLYLNVPPMKKELRRISSFSTIYPVVGCHKRLAQYSSEMS